MGYIFDHLASRWIEKQVDNPSPEHKARRERQRVLLNGLIKEVERDMTGETHLYCSLLARTIVSKDQQLMRDFGEQVAEMAVEH
jgi:hypothetical protein